MNVADSSFLIPLVCSVLGFLGLIVILFLIVWHNRQLLHKLRNSQPHLLERQRTNNESDTHITRYRNPLFETDKGGGGGTDDSPLTAELLEINLEKYENSPRRIYGGHMGSFHGSSKQQNVSNLNRARVKDINIEISRTQVPTSEIVEVL